MERGKKGQQPLLVRQQHLCLNLGGKCSFPLAHITEVIVSVLVFSQFLKGEAGRGLQCGNDCRLVTHQDLLLWQGEGGMRHPGESIGIPMEGALPMTHGEIEAGQDLQPPENHACGGLQ